MVHRVHRAMMVVGDGADAWWSAQCMVMMECMVMVVGDGADARCIGWCIGVGCMLGCTG